MLLTMAVTISGEAKKFMVRRLPSFRALKLRLKEVKIAVASVLRPCISLCLGLVRLVEASFEGQGWQENRKLTVLLALLLGTLPLSDTGTTSVGKDLATNSLEIRLDAVPFDSGVDQLRPAQRDK